MARGERVVLHCMGGLGRPGTVAARLLVEFGLAPEAAIGRVREARPLREKAQVVAMVSARTARVTFTPPVKMVFQIFRRYLLDDDQAVYACKHYRDAIVKQLLPGSSDSLTSGNQFFYKPQVQVKEDRDEGVAVQIFQLAGTPSERR